MLVFLSLLFEPLFPTSIAGEYPCFDLLLLSFKFQRGLLTRSADDLVSNSSLDIAVEEGDGGTNDEHGEVQEYEYHQGVAELMAKLKVRHPLSEAQNVVK